uniref:Small ribosomal subunit protein uS3c n=1 Tax=Palpitomonas bilix TaxID=652834 RepID=A0A1E1GHR4_9EUKA|nr:30S ribosomal protein S3 [Palpitomonas bilix]BAV82412.1 30S ribosomal protein S3 [Palpitomonas bilix]
MGQKTNPNSLRLIVKKDWKNVWHCDKNVYANLMHNDIQITKLVLNYLKKNKYYSDTISITRLKKQIKINVHIYPIKDAVSGNLSNLFKNTDNHLTIDMGAFINYLNKYITKTPIELNLEVLDSPLKNANILSQFIAYHLERRVSLRNIFITLSKVFKVYDYLKGLKIKCSGRINGVEMARSSEIYAGNLSLQTFNEKVVYSTNIVNMKYGTLGLKVWVCYK